MINNISDIFEKFRFSWLTTAGLTVATPKLELLFPLVVQFMFIIASQIIAFGVDYMRQRYLSQRSKTTVNYEDNSIIVKTEIQDKEEDKREH